MTVHLLNYADWRFCPQYRRLQQKQNNSAQRIGIRNVINWNRKKLVQTKFYKAHKGILDHRLGAGLWLWNPFLIYKHLITLTAADVLVYCDCDIWFNNSIDKLVHICENNNGMFHIKSLIKNSKLTKGYCFKTMQCDSPEYYLANQVVGGFVILKKNAFTVKFYKEYLDWCCDVKLINNKLYGVPNQKEFKNHRHPQSVLSLLHKKYNLNSFEFPCIRNVKKTHRAIKLEYSDFEEQQNAKFRGLQILKGQGCK
jgi:hypothetical protein